MKARLRAEPVMIQPGADLDLLVIVVGPEHPEQVDPQIRAITTQIERTV